VDSDFENLPLESKKRANEFQSFNMSGFAAPKLRSPMFVDGLDGNAWTGAMDDMVKSKE